MLEIHQTAVLARNLLDEMQEVRFEVDRWSAKFGDSDMNGILRMPTRGMAGSRRKQLIACGNDGAARRCDVPETGVSATDRRETLPCAEKRQRMARRCGDLSSLLTYGRIRHE
ncbi:MAG TPA: hypothetical protein VFK96_08165 [Gammaproteobacteria bacterium]|nr:hypothetical protein [Gammaproteobacteria bacterium]